MAASPLPELLSLIPAAACTAASITTLSYHRRVLGRVRRAAPPGGPPDGSESWCRMQVRNEWGILLVQLMSDGAAWWRLLAFDPTIPNPWATYHVFSAVRVAVQVTLAAVVLNNWRVCRRLRDES